MAARGWLLAPSIQQPKQPRQTNLTLTSESDCKLASRRRPCVGTAIAQCSGCSRGGWRGAAAAWYKSTHTLLPWTTLQRQKICPVKKGTSKKEADECLIPTRQEAFTSANKGHF